MPKNNLPPPTLPSIPELKSRIIEIKEALNGHCSKVAFLASEEDFYSLISLRSELKATVLISTKLFEQWIERKI